MAKADKSIKKGFKVGGASDIEFVTVGKNYRRATMIVAGKPRTVFKIPSSSHLDDAALQRKARDFAKRFVKQDAESLTW